MKKFFTSESVTEGHPDKICDQISDAILDTILAQDPTSRVACETVTTTGMILVMGEITTSCYADIPKIARTVVDNIGYNRAKYGFDAQTCSVMTAIDEQSLDIALGVDKLGAGDQGMMFGYACDETDEFMPLPITLAHKLTRRLSEVRKDGTMPYLRPDGKSQVTVEYIDGKPQRVDCIVLSTQHSDIVAQHSIETDVAKHIINEIIPTELLRDTKILVNPTGKFIIGGPHGDSGLTGRKIIVDTYGGYARHGGGAFSGKDPTKVDRSAAYAARQVAKSIVAARIARQCEVQLSYAIGCEEPTSVWVDTFGTEAIPPEDIVKLIRKSFDLTPMGIINGLDLRRPIYLQTASYGHFGRSDLDLPWEKIVNL